MAQAQELTEKDGKRKIVEQINAVAKWNLDYPLDPQLQYVYPAPTVTILTNIVNALAAVPRFYVQVLHLMNKMNLPAPFGLQTLTPPIPDDIPPPLPPETAKPPEPDVLDREDMEFSTSSEESELESDTENARKVLEAEPTKRSRKREHQSRRKKLRLQIQMQAQMQAITGIMQKPVAATQNVEDVFEQAQPAAAKKIAIKKIGSEASSQPATSVSEHQLEQDESVEPERPVVVGGFGKIHPEQRECVESEDEGDEEWGQRDFISSRRLRRGRLSDKERSQLDIFKNYSPGEPTSRLYIKNLSKKATEKDLHYVFGRYIDWNVETEKSMFYVQLLTGRMKGQAFVTLPSEQCAMDALEDTNGFQLHGKPIVVQFARSAKPKDKDVVSAS